MWSNALYIDYTGFFSDFQSGRGLFNIMDEAKKETIKRINYCSYNPEVNEGFYLITEYEQVEIINKFLLEDIIEFKRTGKPGYPETGHSYHVDIRTPGKSLQKALKGSRYLHDSKFSGSMTMDEYKKYEDTYLNFQAAPSKFIEDIIKPLHNKKVYSSFLGQLLYTKKQRDKIINFLITINNIFGINLSKYWEYTLVFNFKFYTDKYNRRNLERQWKEHNLSQNKKGLLGTVKDELYKIKEDLILDLKEQGFTEEEIKVIDSCSVFNIDRSPYTEKQVSLEDPENYYTRFGTLFNSLSRKKIKVNTFGNKTIEKSNVKDCLYGYLTEENFYIYTDAIYRILKKCNKFYISICFNKYEEMPKREGHWPGYVWSLDKLWEYVKVHPVEI